MAEAVTVGVSRVLSALSESPLWSVRVDGSGDGRRVVEVGLRRVLVVEGIEAEIMSGAAGLASGLCPTTSALLLVSDTVLLSALLTGAPRIFRTLICSGLCVVRVEDERVEPGQRPMALERVDAGEGIYGADRIRAPACRV